MSFMDLLWIFAILIFLLILYFTFSSIRESQYFRSRNVLHLPSNVFTNFYYIVFKKKGVHDILKLNYETMRKAQVTVAGRVEMKIVTYIVTDLDILKHVLVKDFDHFVNRRAFSFPESDILVKKMLIFLYDEKWKGLRSKLSPTFTTGKIKRLFHLFNESSKKLVNYIDERMEDSTNGEIDLGDGYSKFTMDTIASAVCGMDSKAFDQVDPSIFEQMGKKMQIQSTVKNVIGFLILFTFPKLATKMGLSLFGEDVHDFFAGAIKSSIKQRKATGEKGNDFIQLMMEAREDKLKTDESELNSFEKDALIKNNPTSEKASTAQLLDDDGIVSNCVLFILAGFDTTQSLLLFCAYALAIHPEIQDRLRKEVESVLEEEDGDFTYESLHKMTYLDMVINETLRYYPPVPTTDRGCTQDYTLPGTNVLLKKGNGILIPVVGIHHDERYYPEPEKFDPERFSPENKGKINTYTFLPFGQGPRNCIGMRLALTEVKIAIAQIVHNFDIEPSKKTNIPMIYDNVGSLKPKGGMWLSLKRRPGTKL